MTPATFNLLLRPTLMPETQALRQRKLSIGGSINIQHLRAADYFFRATQAVGIRSKLRRCNLFIGEDLASALIPDINTLGSATDTNNNFVSGDYDPAIGITGNGSTKDLTPGVNRNQTSQNSVHLAGYVTALGNTAANRALVGDNSNPGLHLFLSVNGVTARIQSNIARDRATISLGLAMGSRITSTDQVVSMKRNGTSYADVSSSLSSSIITIFSRSSNNIYNDGSMGGYSIGTGLSPSETQAYSDIWDTTMRMLGRPTP